MTPARYLLDTSVVLNLVRGKELGRYIEATFKVNEAAARSFVCVVSHAEARVLAKRNNWGNDRLEALENFLASFATVEIKAGPVVQAYVDIELASQAHPTGSRNMGKNDLWIAAAAKATRSTLLTTDADFAHLAAEHLRVVVIDPAIVRRGSPA